MNQDGTNKQAAIPECRECGYPIENIKTPVCPECGWKPGTPVSGQRRRAAVLFYFACIIPIIEAMALVAWGLQRVIIPPASQNTTVTAIGTAVLGVITSIVVTSTAKHKDSVFARLRWACFALAIAIGAGLGVLAVFRPGGNAVLLYALALFNAGIAFIVMQSADAKVSVLEPEPSERSDQVDG